MAVILSVVFAFFSSIYLSDRIRNKLIYGSFTGELNKKVTFSLCAENKEVFDIKDFVEKYKVLLIWDDCYGIPHGRVQTLQQYYWNYKGNDDVRFYLVSVNCMSKNIHVKYGSHHFAVPFYIVEDSISFCKELGVYKENEFACLLRNDTLIYKNTIQKVGEYLDELIRKTQ